METGPLQAGPEAVKEIEELELSKHTKDKLLELNGKSSKEPTEVPNTLNTPVTISQPTSQPTGGQSTGGQANNYWPEKIIGGTVAGGLAGGAGYYLYKKRNNG